MHRQGLFLVLGSLALSAACNAPLPADSSAYVGPELPANTPEVLRELAGAWILAGPVQGEETEYTLDAQWVLGGAFLELTLRDRAEPPEYEARIFLGRGEEPGVVVAHWLDVFGGEASKTIGLGRASGQRIELHFDYDSSPFRDVIELDPAAGGGRFTITYEDADGSTKVFGDQRMRRR